MHDITMVIDSNHKVSRQCKVRSWQQWPNILAWQMIPLCLSECEALSACITKKKTIIILGEIKIMER
ncbi:hypothetical protein Fmac_021928 [Flemingia macrophylla]|uniref:Uncharacterized protein n=1 Tax=Flemingia macrophylla TaxID=520843 RepID=A0ABD1LYE4_9FABA